MECGTTSAFYEKMNIKKSFISLSSPHIYFGDNEQTKNLARSVNYFGATLAQKYPDKFNLLASLPLPNTENSIAEIKYDVETLQVSGFTLPTNTLGTYLGNSQLDPVLMF
ncbi:hypothetical protein [Pediococcus pentosaceus]|uniref:hypothetical protein n=1 Tax=Pediococcus pentosaceus TaxID=1255 RepID=UPI00190F9ECD|nr:hypothetical protein [Pediococcus pentosaceus]